MHRVPPMSGGITVYLPFDCLHVVSVVSCFIPDVVYGSDKTHTLVVLYILLLSNRQQVNSYTT